MAHESENRCHYSVKVDEDGTILARTAGVRSVTRTGAGTYRIVSVDGVGIAEECHELCVAGHDSGEGIIPRSGSAERIDANTYDIHTYQNVPESPADADAAFSFTMWKTSNSNGT